MQSFEIGTCQTLVSLSPKTYTTTPKIKTKLKMRSEDLILIGNVRSSNNITKQIQLLGPQDHYHFDPAQKSREMKTASPF